MATLRLLDKWSTTSTLGCISKGVYTDGTSKYLVKGNLKLETATSRYRKYGLEPYSEAIACIVGEELGFNVVHYDVRPAEEFPEIKVYHCPHVSICKFYTVEKGYQKITPIAAIHSYLGGGALPDIWHSYLQLPIVDIEHELQMFLLDAIIGNMDRHLNNWELALAPNGKLYSGKIPIFDNGESLLSLINTGSIRKSAKLGVDKSKPFQPTHYLQMQLIKRTFVNFRLSIDKQAVWNRIAVRVAPILSLYQEKTRQDLVFDYLKKRFDFYVDMFNS